MKILHLFKEKILVKTKSVKKDKMKNKEAYLTMMLIPHGQGQAVKNYVFSGQAVKAAVVGCLFCVLIVGFFVNKYFSLQYAFVENQELQQINLAQAVEIEDLKGLTGKMQYQLEALMEIDREIRTKVGLLEPNAGEQGVLQELQGAIGFDPYYTLLTLGLTERPFASRSNQSGFFRKSEQGPDLTAFSLLQKHPELKVASKEELDPLDDLKVELAKMDRLLTEQAESMDKLKYDVEKQLAAEQAVPETWPIQGIITSGFGMRDNPFDHSVQEFHEGVDIDGTYGMPICAAGYGVVTMSGYHAAWGNVVLVSHGFGYVSKYAHNASLLVKKGDKVERGQIIARLGSTGRATGAHLHFGIAKNGEWIDPLTVLK